MSPVLTARAWAEILAHCQRDWPVEACGMALWHPEANDGCGMVMVLPIENIAGACHARDPRRFPRPAEESYVMAPDGLLRVARVCRSGAQVRAIYHSHTRREGAKFSADDRAGALLLDGHVPAHPEAVQVVISLDARGPTEATGYRWDPAAREFAYLVGASFSRHSGEILWQGPEGLLIEEVSVPA